jgi:hypothetical protein
VDVTEKDANNFYENYAEDTKGKRKGISKEPDASISLLGAV